jgi:hypothetical protein
MAKPRPNERSIMFRLRFRTPQPRAVSPDHEQGVYEFVDPQDDTAENCAVVAIVEERRQRGRGNDRDLDDVIVELGFEPAEFLRH